MGIAGIKVVHAMPGRIRVKISRLKGNPVVAREIEAQLSDVQGIQRVEVNLVTGSVLVFYDPEQMAPSDSLFSLAGTFAALFPGLNPSELQAWLTSSHDEPNGQFSVADRISMCFGSLNQTVGRSTGGLDLRLLLPLILFFFGVRGLLMAEKVAFPTWYDLLWFAFGTFFMLNPQGVEARR
jgi:Heavy metal associated domain 2